MQPVLLVNPKKRRSRGSRVMARGSAAAKAWGARMRRLRSLKKNPTHRPHRKHRVRRNPSARASFRARTASFRSSSIMAMLKGAAIGASGALLTDVIFGYAGPMLPTSMQTAVDPSTGSMNPLYYVAKGGLALGLGVLGKRFTRSAPAMAEGALTVQAYGLLKSLVPTGLTMGAYVNQPRGPAAVANNNVRRIGAQRGMGAYVPMQAREAVRR